MIKIIFNFYVEYLYACHYNKYIVTTYPNHPLSLSSPLCLECATIGPVALSSSAKWNHTSLSRDHPPWPPSLTVPTVQTFTPHCPSPSLSPAVSRTLHIGRDHPLWPPSLTVPTVQTFTTHCPSPSLSPAVSGALHSGKHIWPQRYFWWIPASAFAVPHCLYLAFTSEQQWKVYSYCCRTKYDVYDKARGGVHS